MLRKLLFCATVLFFSVNINLLAQIERDSTGGKERNNNFYDWDNYEWFGWEFHGKPFIELNYGIGSAKHDKLKSKFADVGLAEIKLGYATQESFYNDNIIDFHDKYSFGSKLSADLKSSSAKLGEMKSELWRFGFANRSGFGYKIGAISILPYHGSGFVWSKLDMNDYPAKFYFLLNPPMDILDAQKDTDILNRYHDAFRFGTLSEGGVRFEVASFASLDFAYEAAVIFPRYVFWKHAGSLIIEEGTMGVLNHFIGKIADSSPYAAPIVNFFLKNGLSYAFFSLKKANMNWPFATEAPLTYETIKVGFTFTF
ncbi:MAG: hypothetical protein CVV24_01855 [Ignavibacteriae bacterium HGW-Ignavibacteriae-3]|nr:MAG: hypothetical protein CVV24_01855 [Ignavibacteriae bacterium HGW-Ignavibacteriae-3]